MSLRGWAPGKEVTEPRGMWSSVAQKRKGSPQRASFAQNVRISPGVVATRPGLTPSGVGVVGKVTGLYNWLTPSGSNLLFYLEQSGTSPSWFVRQLDLATNAKKDIFNGAYSFPATPRSLSFAEIGPWLYLTAYDVNSNGAMQCYVYDGNTYVDMAFRPSPTVTSVTYTDGGNGYCSPGLHYFWFIYQNRTGFLGYPMVNTQSSYTITTGSSRQINISVAIPALGDGGGTCARRSAPSFSTMAA